MALQKNYNNKLIAGVIGDLVKNDEPNDLEVIVSAEELFPGTVVVYKDGKISNVKSVNVTSDFYGVVLNDNAEELVDFAKKTTNITIPEGRNARVVRFTSKCSVWARIFVISEGENLFVLTEKDETNGIPAGSIVVSAEATYTNGVKLDNKKFKIRTINGCDYLEYSPTLSAS